MLASVNTEKWTYQRLLKELPAESRYEIRNYHLIDIPSPIIQHQRIVGMTYRLLFQFVIQNQLGEVFISPLDVVFEESNVCEPDVIFVAKENKDIIGKKILQVRPICLLKSFQKARLCVIMWRKTMIMKNLV